jgi:hopanoid biosynthesis associated protein HpnK
VKRLVVTGDDFGLSSEINRAVIEAHERGILTSASLMIGAPAALEAVELARAHPGLAVGLHLVVLDGQASLHASEIPRLVGAEGNFRRSAFPTGIRYQFSRPARRELAEEIRAQLESFQETGLALSHVDGHHHMHLHPVVLGILIGMAPDYGIRWIRLPSEELALALGADEGGFAGKVFWSVVFGLLRRSGARRLRAAGIGFSDRVYGLLATGRIREDYLLRLLPGIRADVVELYCHPTRASIEPPSPLGLAADPELAALLSAPVREALSRNGFVLTNFVDLDRGSRPAALRQAR